MAAEERWATHGGIGPAQNAVLSALLESGPLSVLQLAALGLDPRSARAAVASLERWGIVEAVGGRRRRQRAVLFALTERGQEFARDHFEAASRAAGGAMPEEREFSCEVILRARSAEHADAMAQMVVALLNAPGAGAVARVGVVAPWEPAEATAFSVGEAAARAAAGERVRDPDGFMWRPNRAGGW